MATDQAIAMCGGDMRSTIRVLILANEFLESELETQVSHGYTRGVKHGRVKAIPAESRGSHALQASFVAGAIAR